MCAIADDSIEQLCNTVCASLTAQLRRALWLFRQLKPTARAYQLPQDERTVRERAVADTRRQVSAHHFADLVDWSPREVWGPIERAPRDTNAGTPGRSGPEERQKADQAPTPTATPDLARAAEEDIRCIVREEVERALRRDRASKKAAFIASKGTLDRAYPPLILATPAAAAGMETAVFFTFYPQGAAVR